MQMDEQDNDSGYNLDWLVQYSPKDVTRAKTFQIFRDRPFISFAVPLYIDRLLVEWLKLDRLETDESHIVGSIFCQSRKNNPHGFSSVAISNSKNCDPYDHQVESQVLHRPITQYIGLHHCWIESHTEYPENYPNFLYAVLTKHFPFLFVRILPTYQSLTEFEIIAKTWNTQDHFDNESIDITVKVCPTSDPSVFLIIVSSILETDKDCAKLLRSFVKKDLPSSWDLFESNTSLKNLNVSLNFKHPCVYSSTCLLIRRDYLPNSKAKSCFANQVLAGEIDFDLPAMVFYNCFDVSELLNE